MSRLFVLILSAAFLFSACAKKKKEGEPEFTLKFGHLANEQNTWHLASLKFKELVEARSKGRIQVKVYPNSQLGREMELIEGIRMGTADLTITGESLQNRAPLAAMLAVPYAYETSEQMRAAAGGVIGEKISAQIIEKTGLVPIAWFERGPRHLTSNRPIRRPADLKGIKIRVPNVPLYVDVWQALGAKPTPMAFGEVFTSLQQNTIDAQENPLSLIESASFFEVQKYVNLTAHVRSWIYVVIGQKKLKKMPPDLQEIVMQAGKEMQAYENELFLKEETELRTRLEKKGMEFINSNQESFAHVASEAVGKSVGPKQKELLELIKASD